VLETITSVATRRRPRRPHAVRATRNAGYGAIALAASATEQWSAYLSTSGIRLTASQLLQET
jgi:hypothetical protein